MLSAVEPCMGFSFGPYFLHQKQEIHLQLHSTEHNTTAGPTLNLTIIFWHHTHRKSHTSTNKMNFVRKGGYLFEQKR